MCSKSGPASLRPTQMTKRILFCAVNIDLNDLRRELSRGTLKLRVMNQ